MGRKFKLKNIITAPIKALQQTATALAKGDLAGAAKGALKGGMLVNPMTGLPYATALEAKDAFNSLSPEEQAANASLAPPDPNIEVARQMEEERKRRLRTPGRAQYNLSQNSNMPSLIGENSVLGKNGLF